MKAYAVRPAHLPLLLLIALLVACTNLRLHPAVPEAGGPIPELPGFPGVRDWGDEISPEIDRRVDYFAAQLQAEAKAAGKLPNDGRLDSLVLSGGGADGPFAAGLLVGWTGTGERPDFTIVTGISAGALIAPFAFLGPGHDDVLRRFTFEAAREPLFNFRILSGLIDGIGLLDTTPLERRLRKLITPEVVRQIAAEHDKGRRLIVGTTNLDAQRPVHWRIDQIAKLGVDRPEETADLIARILIASASIPGVFAPQFFTVQKEGRTYSEMHVDGGVTHQLIFVPLDVDFARKLPREIYGFARRGTIYVIRNSKVGPEQLDVAISTFDIMSRSVSTLIKYDGRANIDMLRQQALRNSFGIKVISVPETFDVQAAQLFDPAYMQALFDLGYQLAGRPDSWQIDIPPAPLEE